MSECIKVVDGQSLLELYDSSDEETERCFQDMNPHEVCYSLTWQLRNLFKEASLLINSEVRKMAKCTNFYFDIVDWKEKEQYQAWMVLEEILDQKRNHRNHFKSICNFIMVSKSAQGKQVRDLVLADLILIPECPNVSEKDLFLIKNVIVRW